MHLLQLKEPKLLQAAIETKEQHLCMYHHLIEEMHHITLSSAKTMEEAAEATTEEITGTITNDEGGSNSSNDNITPPTPHVG